MGTDHKDTSMPGKMDLIRNAHFAAFLRLHDISLTPVNIEGVVLFKVVRDAEVRRLTRLWKDDAQVPIRQFMGSYYTVRKLIFDLKKGEVIET